MRLWRALRRRLEDATAIQHGVCYQLDAEEMQLLIRLENTAAALQLQAEALRRHDETENAEHLAMMRELRAANRTIEEMGQAMPQSVAA